MGSCWDWQEAGCLLHVGQLGEGRPRRMWSLWLGWVATVHTKLVTARALRQLWWMMVILLSRMSGSDGCLPSLASLP